MIYAYGRIYACGNAVCLYVTFESIVTILCKQVQTSSLELSTGLYIMIEQYWQVFFVLLTINKWKKKKMNFLHKAHAKGEMHRDCAQTALPLQDVLVLHVWKLGNIKKFGTKLPPSYANKHRSKYNLIHKDQC